MVGSVRSTSLSGILGTAPGSSAGRVCVLVLGLLVAGVGALQAQTGPGGVGATDGNSSLELWLKADEGASTFPWADQSGNTRDASVNSGDPQLLTNINTINDKPAIQFDGNDGLIVNTTNNDDLESLPTSANTVFVVSRRTGSNSNGQYIFSVNGDERLLAYDVKPTNTSFNFAGLNKGGTGINPTTSSFKIGSSLFDPNGAGGNTIDAVFNSGTSSSSNADAKTGNAGDVFIGENGDNNNIPYLNGDVAEVVAYSRNLNAAEVRIVLNYLAAKYDLSINSTYNYYGFGAYPDDVAGIGDASASAPGGATGPGVATSGSDNGSVESSILGLNGSVTDAFALFGHDGDPISFNTSSGNPPDAQRLKRQWRVDLSGASSVSISADSVDLTGVGTGSFDDFGLFVDGDGDFTTTSDQTFHDLEDVDNNDIYTASSFTVNDGDRIAIARIDRKVSFTSTSGNGFENGSNPSITASVNYEDGSPIDVSFGSTADLDGSGCFEDGRTDTDSDGSCEIRNDNDNFEADDGSSTGDENGNDKGGSFDGDFQLSTTSPATINANSSSTTITLNLDNDGLQEQTEKFEVNLTGISAGKATLGSPTTFTFSILDDDEDRDVKFVDSDYTDGDSDPKYNPSSSEGDGGASRVEKFTVKLREDGAGTSAASSSPYTTVDFTVDGTNSEANFGTDLTNSLVDVRIKNESGSDGTEYQERLSATSGRIYFASGAGSSTLKLEINEDGLEDDDLEDIVLNLENPVSSALGPDSTQTKFQISDDDGPPNVSFTSGTFSGDESNDAKLKVELGQVAGTSLDITFQDDGSGSASDPDDYDFPDSPTITVPSGNTSGSFTIPVVDDNTEEGDETIDVSIASVSITNNGATLSPGGSPTSATYTIIDNEGVGSVGPGGVGSTDGSGNLAMWLRPDQGVFSDDGCSTQATDTGNVGCWQDQSGSGNNATQATTGNQPSYQTGILNNKSIIRFDRNNSDRFSHPLTGIGGNNNTIFAVVNRSGTGNQEGIFSVAPEGSEGNKRVVTARSLRFPASDAAEALNGDDTTPATSTNSPGTSASILSSTFISGSTTLDVGVDGQGTDSGANDHTGENGVEARIGAEIEGLGNNKGYGDLNFLDADVAEIVAYTTDLNTAQRNIVRNYLSAKFNVPLSANNLYAGDTNGDYDFNVIGIGKEGGSDPVANGHTRAQAEGVTLNIDAFNNGNYVMLGTKKLSANPNKVNFTNTNSSTLNLDVRADRVRFASVRDVNGNGAPSFNVTYDLSDIGLKGTAGRPGNYKLLYAGVSSCTPGGGCDWSDAGGSVSVSGDQITISGASLAAGDYYVTLGTTDAARSPLINPRGRTIAGSDGDGGDNLGTDAGWRYVGVPMKGATIDDLQPPISTQRNGFVTHSVAMDYHWSLANGTENNDDGWTQLDSGDQIPNGRGFILYLYDDKYYPIDPEIPLDVANINGTPGASDVTVGEETSPSYDTALRQDTLSHLLANPYNASFDLTGNLSGPSGGDLSASGFSSTIQLWNPETKSYEMRTQGTDGDNIAKWQGFFVSRSEKDKGDTQLTFNSAGRGAGSVGFVGSKSRTTVQYRMIGLRIRAQNSGEEVARDEAVGVYFRRGGTRGWDGHDAPKFTPFSRDYVALAPLGLGQGDSTMTPKAMESRPYTPSDTVVVPLRLDVEGVSGTMIVEAREWKSIPDDWTVTLVDTKADERIPFDSGAQYSFSYDGTKRAAKARQKTKAGAADGIPQPSQLRMKRRSASSTTDVAKAVASSSDGSSTRFKLRVTPSSEALPVELAEMDAQTDGQSVLLQWSTASETNNAGFYVEHQRLNGDSTASPTPEAWTRTGFLEGSGTTDSPQEYRHKVSGLDYGQHAFRLRQVDTDGSETTSEVIKTDIRLDGSHSVSAPYPNPVRRQATLEITVREAQPVRVALYDVLGRRVRTVFDEGMPEQKTQRIQIDSEDLSSGHYFLRVQGEDFVETQRMTVVR